VTTVEDFSCFDLAQTIACIASDLQTPHRGVAAAFGLFQEGNTIPFIARYRKEVTGSLDEIALRFIEDALTKAKELADRKATILKSISGQDLLTTQLREQILACQDKKTLEDLYLPYKPKRRTKATIARERGLGPLAELLLAQQKLDKTKKAVVAPFVDPAKDVPDEASALAGACDIVAEVWSEDAGLRAWLVKQAQHGKVGSTVKRGKKEGGEKFEQYFDHSESVKRIPSHRLLAMLRGQSEGFLNVGLQLEDDVVVGEFKRQVIVNLGFEFRGELVSAAEDCYKRLLLPATESAVLEDLREKADVEAIDVFASNLKQLLLSPPAGSLPTLGIDPGFRTGCKVAVVDGTGKFLTNTTIYPTPPKSDTQGAAATLKKLIETYDIQLIAIGNGTASRETDAFVTSVLKEVQRPITKVVVSESGASIYSASDVAIAEYPELDLTVRGAISIAHRLQDPLAELVKLDPKSIGVGQYQHDVNQSLLKKSLEREVQSCVNQVGVNLNSASPSLLSYVAGIGPKLATSIVGYRDQNGEFQSRQQLLNVPKLGKKAFQQAAGFLRIRDAKNPLDNSAVHPETYHVVEKMASTLSVKTKALLGSSEILTKLQPNDFVDDQFGLPTIKDILQELVKPGRDPRKEFQTVDFAEGVNQIADLAQGMTLQGVVTNVTKFGAFVDIGVHQDGLVHISQLANRYISDPSEEVTVGDVIKVKVLEVDAQRKRISLSKKDA